jgi:hypothetical protein
VDQLLRELAQPLLGLSHEMQENKSAAVSSNLLKRKLLIQIYLFLICNNFFIWPKNERKLIKIKDGYVSIVYNYAT